MSRFPPPPGQGFAPPPPAGQFPPPPGQQAPPNRGFPPAPNMQQQQQAPTPPGGGGFGPPPPGPPQQLQQGMANMNIGGQQQQPPPPGNQPGMFAPPPPAGGGFAPQPPPGQGAGFAPQPPPGGGFAPQPPPGGGFAPQPPPGGGFAPPPPGQGGPPPPGPPGAPRAPVMFTPGMAAGGGAAPPPPGGPGPQGPSSSFYQQPPNQAPPRAAAPPGPPGMAGAPGMGAQIQENIDFNIQIPKRLCQFTCGAIPGSKNLMAASKVPVGGVIRPLAPAMSEEDEVDTVQPGNAGIIRCKRCRTYINAFVTWVENGRRWRCNICAQLNECPSTYFCHLDENGDRRDKDQRPELSKGVVEFIAPAEYMVRPPQEPTYFFVIDVSATAVRSGMLHSAAEAIRRSLDDLPGRGRTKIGFITYDNSVHYYNLAPDLSAPQMMVVSDLKELFVPLPDHLLVNVNESRSVVEAFLDNLPEMFSKNPVVSQSCLGPALKAAFTVMKQIGGKMSVFQSIQPNLGDGALRPRENQAMMGTPAEIKLLKPDVPWYKDTAVEFSRQQISVDMYLFPYQYMDVSALSELPKYTAGTLHSYVGFNPEKDGPRFESQLHKRLTQKTAFEAVMRIRCTKGMRITNFYGNFFIRGTDLLALPNCTSDSVFAFDLAHDEQNMPSTVVTVQAALLYTSSEGQRRIRVMTQALPITNSTSELINSIDTDTVCNLMSKQALDMSFKTTLDNARMRLQQTCVDIIRAAKGGRTVSGYSVPPPGTPGANGGDPGDSKGIPPNLALLPVYTLAMMKNVAFRGGTDVHPDERVCAQFLLNSMWVKKGRDFIYPRMYSIHDMSGSAGLPSENPPSEGDDLSVAGRERILLPQAVNLSCERLTNDGIFLLDNGLQMNLWIGSAADPNLLNALFGVSSLENADMNQIKVNTAGDDFAIRLGSVMMSLREEEGDPYVILPKVDIVREGDPHMEARFFWNLIEDRASFQGGTYSYGEFMEFVNNPQAGGGAPPAPAPGMRGGPGGPGRGPPAPGPPGHPGPGPPGNQGYGAPPPPGGSRGPPPPGQHAPPGPGNFGAPPPPGGGNFGGPPPPGPPQAQQYGQQPPAQAPQQYNAGPPAPGPPRGGGMPPAMPPRSAPPAAPAYGQGPPPNQQGPPPGGGYGGPPPPGSGGYGAPPPPGPPQQQHRSMPPQQQMAPPRGGMPPPPGSGNYGAPPPPGPPRGGMPPPPPMGNRPPPPPPQYR